MRQEKVALDKGVLMEKFNFAEIDANEVLREVIKCYEFSDAMKIKLLKYSENLTYLLYCDYDKKKNMYLGFSDRAIMMIQS